MEIITRPTIARHRDVIVAAQNYYAVPPQLSSLTLSYPNALFSPEARAIQKSALQSAGVDLAEYIPGVVTPAPPNYTYFVDVGVPTGGIPVYHCVLQYRGNIGDWATPNLAGSTVGVQSLTDSPALPYIDNQKRMLWAASYPVTDIKLDDDTWQLIEWRWQIINVGYTSNGNWTREYHLVTDDNIPASFPAHYDRPPNYYNLIGGYQLDHRQFPFKPKIETDRGFTIGYYKNNLTEPIPDLKSLDWFEYDFEPSPNIRAIYLPIEDVVLGTFWCSDEIVKQQISNLTQTDRYPCRYLFPENLPELFTHWRNLHANLNPNPSVNAQEIGRVVRLIQANNNVWQNDTNTYLDRNLTANHPMLQVDDDRAFDWHLKPQLDGSYGKLIMDSPLIKNIGAALNATKWGINPDSPDLPRVDDLGWRIQRTNEVLGIRVGTNGQIDVNTEIGQYRRTHADGSDTNDPQVYGINGFGSKGKIVRHLPNRRTPNGRTRSGGYRKVHDIPQLLAELHEQANSAMGYQEGAAIEITIEGEKYVFPNQLALLIDLFTTLKQTQTYSKMGFFSSVVGEQSIKEVMAGLGLRTVDKYLEFDVAGKTAKLYYKGISASQSLGRKLSAIATNIGIAIGNIS